MATHPFGPIENQLIIGYKPIRRPNDIANLKLSAKVIEKRVFESTLHPILLRESGAPTIARLNAEGYGVHFSVEGETNPPRAIPKVTYTISREGSIVTVVDLTEILANGISKFEDDLFDCEGFWCDRSAPKPSETNISLIAPKILAVCNGCTQLQIDSTPERLRIVRDGVEELNSRQELTEERMHTLKKYEFFLKLSDPGLTAKNYFKLDPKETFRQRLSREGYSPSMIIRRVLDSFDPDISRWCSDSRNRNSRYLDSVKAWPDTKNKLQALINQKTEEMPHDTLVELIEVMIAFLEPEQVYFYLGLTDESLLDKVVAKLTADSKRELQRFEKPDVKLMEPTQAPARQEEPRFGFEINHGTEVKVLEFWRTGEKETRRYRMQLCDRCTGEYTTMRGNSLLYMHTGDRGNFGYLNHQTALMPLMLNLELLTAVLTPYTPTAETDAAVAAGEAEIPPDFSAPAEPDPFENFLRLAYGYDDYYSHSNEWFASPYGGIWWFGNEDEKGEAMFLSFWHPDHIFYPDSVFDAGEFFHVCYSNTRQTMKMHFCPTGQYAFFGTIGYQPNYTSSCNGYLYGYWLFCFEIYEGGGCFRLDVAKGDDILALQVPDGTKLNQHITWMTCRKHIFCAVGLHNGELHIHWFKNEQFVPVMNRRLKYFSRKYIMTGEMTAKTRIPKSNGNKRTHYTVRLSLKF